MIVRSPAFRWKELGKPTFRLKAELGTKVKR